MELPAEIKFEKKGHVGIVTIDRPEAMNALTADMLLGIEDAMKALNDDIDTPAALANRRAICKRPEDR